MAVSRTVIVALGFFLVHTVASLGSSLPASDYKVLKDSSSYDFAKDFYVDEILQEMQAMGLRPKVKQQLSGDFNDTEEESSMKIVNFSLDYTDEKENEISNVKKRSADVSDILADEPKASNREPRLFYNFDRGSAFNTSVAFTIPLFSFTLPGAGDVTDGVDGNIFGTMAFVTLFLVGGLGVAIYTTTQGAIGGDARMITPIFPGSQFLDPYAEASLTDAVYDALYGFSDALDLPSCSRLAVCEAYSDPTYGALALPFKIYAPLKPEVSEAELTPQESAARFAAEGGNCQHEYQCLVDPLYTLGTAVDKLYGYWRY